MHKWYRYFFEYTKIKKFLIICKKGGMLDEEKVADRNIKF